MWFAVRCLIRVIVLFLAFLIYLPGPVDSPEHVRKREYRRVANTHFLGTRLAQMNRQRRFVRGLGEIVGGGVKVGENRRFENP
jgi:hypothetical protein